MLDGLVRYMAGICWCLGRFWVIFLFSISERFCLQRMQISWKGRIGENKGEARGLNKERWNSEFFLSLRIIGPSKLAILRTRTPAIQVQNLPLEGPRSLGIYFISVTGSTVDGWNPTPPGMVLKPYKYWDKLPTSTGDRLISEPSAVRNV